jgi:hypothetical protein
MIANYVTGAAGGARRRYAAAEGLDLDTTGGRTSRQRTMSDPDVLSIEGGPGTGSTEPAAVTWASSISPSS